ncbi:hypothetical protein DRN73_06645 [Candidatus Pacearchaeota archaeon]|nr:MAG: hypothetical protein DRN73_06645 [Candidatus Pacearchaeota archaeon]
MKTEILIMPWKDAREFEPLTDTYAIRILGQLQRRVNEPLKKSERYSDIREYFFDDVSQGSSHTQTFTSENAKQILEDFRKRKKSSSLLVHCLLGQSRSPAVAIALNEVFQVGNDSKELKKKYPLFNRHVYDTMMQEAERFAIN